MAAVLTAASVLTCSHQGPLTVRPSQRLLTVDGQPVLVRADMFLAQIACPLTAGRCLTVTSIDAGLSRTLRVGTEPVLLATARGLTSPSGTWGVFSAGQLKLGAA
jgi:hypothetical protein